MKKKPTTEHEDYNKFKDMAMRLLGEKLFSDYMMIGASFNAEPEHFYEEWMRRSVFQPDEEIRVYTWRYFLAKLISYRKSHKI